MCVIGKVSSRTESRDKKSSRATDSTTSFADDLQAMLAAVTAPRVASVSFPAAQPGTVVAPGAASVTEASVDVGTTPNASTALHGANNPPATMVAASSAAIPAAVTTTAPTLATAAAVTTPAAAPPAAANLVPPVSARPTIAGTEMCAQTTQDVAGERSTTTVGRPVPVQAPVSIADAPVAPFAPVAAGVAPVAGTPVDNVPPTLPAAVVASIAMPDTTAASAVARPAGSTLTDPSAVTAAVTVAAPLTPPATAASIPAPPAVRALGRFVHLADRPATLRTASSSVKLRTDTAAGAEATETSPIVDRVVTAAATAASHPNTTVPTSTPTPPATATTATSTAARPAIPAVPVQSRAAAGMVGVDRVQLARASAAPQTLQRLALDLDGARVAVRVGSDHATVDVVADPAGELGNGWAKNVERSLNQVVRAGAGDGSQHSDGFGGRQRQQRSTSDQGNESTNDAERGRRWSEAESRFAATRSRTLEEN